MSQLFERFDFLVARLDELGIARTADDLRAIADDLRDIPDERLPAEASRVGVALDRLTRIYFRLARGGLPELAEDIERLLDDLRRAHPSSAGS